MESIENQDEIFGLANELKSAYRKYKTHIYYDSYSAIQRLKLADFEMKNFGKEIDLNNEESFSNFSNQEFYKNFNNTFFEIAKQVLNNFDEYIEGIINEINVISIPKIKQNQKDKDIITNFKRPETNVSKIHYFIDLPIEGHILGILWIFHCGYVLDDKLYDNCYGNRLNEYILNKLKSDDYEYDFSPFLFKPYYKNYQSWRDNGLNSVNSLLKNKKNVVMLSLDFKDYYYRSLIDFDDLKMDILNTKKNIYSNNNIEFKENELDNHLNNFIKKVFYKYSELFDREIKNEPLFFNVNGETDYNYKKLPMIPLGFLPSLIIANWNLQGFDQTILENTHPYYYGRYVDDILIVLESHERSLSNGSQHIEEFTSQKFLERYFTPDGQNPFNHIFKFNDSDNGSDKGSNGSYSLYNVRMFKSEEDNKTKYYHYENLEIQESKLRIYTFAHDCSDSIIKNFRKEIFKNSSEFRLMHDLPSIIDDIENNVYKIDYKDSINKLNDIKDVRVNKFEISKQLSRLNHVSKNMVGSIDANTINEILNAFRGNILEFMTLWEKVFSLLYINNKNLELFNFIDTLFGVIKEIKFSNQSKNESYSYKLNQNFFQNINMENVGQYKLIESIIQFLYSSLIRTLSLKYMDLNNEYFKNIMKKIADYYKDCFDLDLCEEISIDISKFIFSLMYNNILMKYPLQNSIKYLDYNNSKNFNFIKPQNGFYGNFIGIYPRFIKFNEFILNNINESLFESYDNECSEKYIKSAMENYEFFNFIIPEEQSLQNKNPFDLILENDLSNIKVYRKLSEIKIESIYSGEKDYNLMRISVGSEKNNSLKVGLLNTKLDENDIYLRLKDKPNLSSDRFDKIKRLINEAIHKKVKLLVMPEMYVPYEWINEIVRISKDHQMAIIFGVEPILNSKSHVGNYIMGTFPFLINNNYQESLLAYRLKNYYSPRELKDYKTYDKEPLSFEKDNEIKKKYYLFNWNNVYIAPYYCFEIANIDDRCIFKNYCDIITVSEFNKDTAYFNNIAESLSRDLFCYCIKSNTSQYGGTVILEPSSSETKYLVNLKGGKDDYIVTYDLDIKKLREEAIKNDEFSENNYFKPKPPGFKREIVKERMGLIKRCKND